MATFRQVAILPGCALSADARERLRELSDQEPLPLPAEPDGVVATQSVEAVDALLCGWSDRVTAQLLDRMPRLRYLGVRGTSTHQIAMRHADRRGIEVRPIYRYGDIGTAEFVVQQLVRWVRDARQDAGQPVRELAGQAVGLVGYGGIARRVARVADALEMRVRFFTPRPRPEQYATWCPLPELLAGSDVVSFHSPPYATVVSAPQLRLVRPEALVVVTTLGLPFPAADFAVWQRARLGPVVLDRCAAHETPYVRGLPGVQVVDLFAARTVESVARAEQALLAELGRAAAGGRAPR
jgi:phosphoglycerate dehydrogenase-like enzyme